MPYSHLNDFPSDVRARAARIRLACFDVDGTLTNGHLVFDNEGRESKAFHVHDGQGLVLLRKAGFEVAMVTARASTIAERRAAELGVRVYTAVGDKLACVSQLARDLGIALEQTAFMGDDLPDLAVMQRVGLSVAPADAHAWVRERAHWRTSACAGSGAARECCDLLLGAQGHADALLAGALADKAAVSGTRS